MNYKDDEVDFSKDTDADLLAYMAMREADEPFAQAAWLAFYERHRWYLYKVFGRAFGRSLGGDAGVCDLVQDTLLRAYESASTFDPNGITDPDRLRRRTRGWLGTIGRNLYCDSATRSGIQLSFPGDLDVFWHREKVAAAPAAGHLVSIAFNTVLDNEEQQVLVETMQTYDPARQHQRMPSGAAAALAQRLETSVENIRQIRHRAFEKIRAYIMNANNAASAKSASPGRVSHE